jgi:thiol-disulfide isomerase/thioredoxin
VIGHPAFCAQNIAIRDCDGALHRPLELAGRKAAVLIFIARECPISNALAPEINRIAAAYTNFAFYLVHADPDTQPTEARRHAHDFGFQAPVLLDPEHRLVKLAGASKTPEAVVLNAEGKVLYRGRINDLYASLGKKRAQPTRQDLREALEAITKGKPAPNTETKVVGCSIPELGK